MKRLQLVFPLLLMSFQPATNLPGPDKPLLKRPKNIILMIGDGMGITQITAAMYANGNRLELERCPVSGLVATHSADELITDSAAGATAFACGCKTSNGVLGKDKNGKNCVNILEQANEAGMATGLVATSTITHATPAGFIAHVPIRSEMEDIATFFVKTKIDFFAGGGLKYFNARTQDQRDLCAEMRQKGFQLFDFKTNPLQSLTPDPAHPFGWFADDDDPAGVLEGRDYLPVAAQMAPAFLKKRSEKGFFLMIEGSQIDWGGHANDQVQVIAETLDFDRAIGEVLRFAEADGETLVIITADHETGGMAIAQGSSMDSLEIEFTSKHHTATLVPVFAFGPGAEQFAGVQDNTDIHRKMQALLALPVTQTANTGKK